MDVVVSFSSSSGSETVSSLLSVPNDDSGILSWLSVVGLERTWDQKLSSGLLLTFMSTHFFQFRFAGTEQYWHPSWLSNSWLFTLTFFRTVSAFALAPWQFPGEGVDEGASHL